MSTTAVAATVQRTSAQAVSNSGSTAIQFQVATNDPYGMANLGVHNDRLTAPVAGLYLCIGQLAFVSGAVGYRLVELLKNGVTVVADSYLWEPDTGASPYYHVCGMVALAVGDWIEMHAYQTGQASLNTGYSSQADCSLAMALLG